MSTTQEPKNNCQFWQVAVEAPLSEPLTYAIPNEFVNQARAGQRVRIPLGRREAFGFLVEPSQKAPDFETKNILGIEEELIEDVQFFGWLKWISMYYLYPLGQVLALAFPPLKKQVKERKSKRAPVVPSNSHWKKVELSNEQKQVSEDILKQKGFNTHLIFGVTGSGKTEIYLDVLEKIISQGKSGLFLLPEISLTPQMIHRFSSRFPDQVAVIHSQLTERERTNQWWEVYEGKKKILLGARSALFCPIPNLGVIIVDEEHEPSYKQDEKLKYHGRDAAIMLGKMRGCPVLLGSATPSLESWQQVKLGKYQLHTLKNRVEGRALPQIHILDLRAEPSITSEVELPKWLSADLYALLKKTYLEKQQSALFLNRRGLAPLVLCESCGYVHECPNCDISLTLHGRQHLVCHYCDYHENYKEACPSCKEGEMKPLGLGTEQIEMDLKKLFPDANVARADRDEIQHREDLERMIQQMESGEIDFLVGTQMIAKGLDFPKLKSIGLVLADIGFNIPDFRSTERSFQLITQVSGRAGRHVKNGEEPGQVIVQTYNPEHPCLQWAVTGDYVAFAEQELINRAELGYPPYGRLAGIRLLGPEVEGLRKTCHNLSHRAEALKKSDAKTFDQIEILGPSESPLSKLRNQYRFQMLVKAKDPSVLHHFCRKLFSDDSWAVKKVKISLDVDPLHLL